MSCIKTKPELEDPIDLKIYSLGDIILPYLKCIGFTPNLITFFSLVFGIVAIYYLYKMDNPFFGVIIPFVVSYFLDCWDGCMARKYQMCSKFGDLFDHIKDLIVNVTFFLILFFNFWKVDKLWFTILLITFPYLIYKTLVYASCQDNYRKQGSMVQSAGDWCPYSEDPKLSIYMKNNRFGSGIFNVIIVPISVMLLFYLKNK